MTAKLSTQTRLRKALRKVSAPQTGWMDIFPAIMGRADGTVLTGISGVVYVRNILNGQVLAVYNATVASMPNMQVEVGKRVDMPGLWQIKGMMEPFSTPSSGGTIGYHAPQHQFPGGADIGFWDRKQVLVLDVLVSDGENFIVQVYGGIIRTGDTYVQVDNQTFDLSAEVITAGAAFVNIEADEDGVLSANAGTNFGAREIATATAIPIPTGGNVSIATVLMYESQTELTNDDILIPWTIERGGVGAQIFSATAKSSIDNADKVGIWDSITGRLRSVTWTLIKSTLKTYFDTIYSIFTTEDVQDIAGGMVSGNTETGIEVTYDDASGKLNFAVTVLEPLTNGDAAAPELVFDGNGDVIMVYV